MTHLSPEQWNRVEREFAVAVELEPPAQAPFLARPERENGVIAAEGRSLLTVRDQMDDFLEHAAADQPDSAEWH